MSLIDLLPTPRDLRIVVLIAQGLTDKEIGQKFGLAENTIGAYVSNLYEKIGVSNRRQLINYFYELRLKPEFSSLCKDDTDLG